MPSDRSVVVIIGTGGTIAGRAADPARQLGYLSGALGVDELVAAVPPLQAQAIEALTVARIDSCNMDDATWRALALASREQLARPEVAGVVVTHGTDTLEETAYFLHRVLAVATADKPLVLTAAMRPATALSADGPLNLLDAVTLVREPGAHGVVAVQGGRVFAGADLRKVHGWRLDAFGAGDAGDIGAVHDGRFVRQRDWPCPDAADADADALLALPAAQWPRVDVLTSHAGARGDLLDAAVAAGARGIVLAGTGNGTVHAELLAAAGRSQARGVAVWRSTRCVLGGVFGDADAGHAGGDAAAPRLPSAGPLTPAQARVALMLALAAGGAATA